MNDLKLYKSWLSAFEQVGISAIIINTSAKIFAILYLYGNNEAFTCNKSFLEDAYYIQRRFGIGGGKIPDPVFLETFNKYVRELKDYEKRNADKKIKKGGAVFKAPVPEWVIKLLKSRYDIKFLY